MLDEVEKEDGLCFEGILSKYLTLVFEDSPAPCGYEEKMAAGETAAIFDITADSGTDCVCQRPVLHVRMRCRCTLSDLS